MSVTLHRPYCTLQEVQRETHNFDDGDETWFRYCINKASRIVEEQTNRKFYFRDFSTVPYTVRRRNVFGKSFHLDWPIISLTEVDERGDDDTQNIVDLDDYGFTEGETSVHCIRDWERLSFRDTIKIKGTFGYKDDPEASDPLQVSSPDLPEEIRRATVLIAAAISAENRREVLSLDGGSTEVADHNIPKEAMTFIKARRKLVV